MDKYLWTIRGAQGKKALFVYLGKDENGDDNVDVLEDSPRNSTCWGFPFMNEDPVGPSLDFVVKKACEGFGCKYDPKKVVDVYEGDLTIGFVVNEDGTEATEEDKKVWREGKKDLFDQLLVLPIQKVWYETPDDEDIKEELGFTIPEPKVSIP